MADRGGFGGSFGDRRGRGRGRSGPGGDRRGGRGGRGRGRGRGRGGRGRGTKEWVPVTKLGRLVKAGKFPTLENIYMFSIKIKEPEIIDHYFSDGRDESSLPKLADEIMNIKPVQKQTTAGQRTRFKAWVAVGDYRSHIGLGQKCAAEVGIAIRGAHTLAKLSLVPVRLGFYGARLGEPHTLPCKLTGKCGSARVRLIPAPIGTGLVAAAKTKQFIAMSGVKDVFCKSRGQTRTTGNFVTCCYLALRKTYKVYTPDQWIDRGITLNPIDEFAMLASGKTKDDDDLLAAYGAA